MELHGRVVVLNGSRLGCCEFGTVVDLNCGGGNEAMVKGSSRQMRGWI